MSSGQCNIGSDPSEIDFDVAPKWTKQWGCSPGPTSNRETAGGAREEPRGGNHHAAIGGSSVMPRFGRWLRLSGTTAASESKRGVQGLLGGCEGAREEAAPLECRLRLSHRRRPDQVGDWSHSVAGQDHAEERRRQCEPGCEANKLRVIWPPLPLPSSPSVELPFFYSGCNRKITMNCHTFFPVCVLLGVLAAFQMIRPEGKKKF